MSARTLACAVLGSMLCACAGLPARESRADDLVGYFAVVARLPPAGQKKALAQAAEEWGRSATLYARAKLGGLYAQPGAALRDDARALSLLEPFAAAPRRDAGDEAGQGVADLAALLYAQVAERQRLARDDAKRQDALRERNESMQERLEAMKAIERSIQQREERQRTR